jgi:hypothetical protein
MKPTEMKDRMDLHRALMRGTGFYGWMTGSNPGDDLSSAMAAIDRKGNKLATQLRRLPTVNLLAIEDGNYAGALLEETQPDDRARFRQYLSNRPLGLGIIAAVSASTNLKTV